MNDNNIGKWWGKYEENLRSLGDTSTSKYVVSISMMYGYGTSKTDPNSVSQWTSDIPSSGTGEYLWSKMTITFSDATKNVIYNVSAGGGGNGIEHIKLDGTEVPASGKTVNMTGSGATQNFKTINGNNIIGKGDITITSNGIEHVQVDGTELPISGKTVNITGKQNTLVSGTNIKTVNGNSVLGQGNIEIRTFSSFPDGVSGYTGSTITAFMQQLNALNLPSGSAYLGGVRFSSGMPVSMQGGNSELIIYVPYSHVYVLEMSSTDSFETLGSGVAGKWMSMWQGTVMKMPWKGMMSCPQNSSGKYVPSNDSDGVSYYYLKDYVSSQKLTVAQINDACDAAWS